MLTFPELSAPRIRSCKICQNQALLYGAIDFLNRKEKHGFEREAYSGHLIFYNRCLNCHFIFTSSFDHWTEEEFKTHIYNADYRLWEKDKITARNDFAIQWISDCFAPVKNEISILDFGSGSGRVGHELRHRGFLDTTLYDPYFGDDTSLPEKQFDVIVMLDVVEHFTQPRESLSMVTSRLKPKGVILQTTTLPPSDFELRGLYWWHILPRIGRVSIFSKKSLEIFVIDQTMNIASFGDKFHVIFKELPDFWPFDRFFISTEQDER